MLEETPVPPRGAPAAVVQGWLPVISGRARKTITDADLTQPYVCLDLPADGRQLRPLRRDLTEWFAQLGITDSRLDDMVLAVCEAVTNAMEHAYAGGPGDGSDRVLVMAVTSPERGNATVVVADRGLWRPPADDPGFRGRGLSIMRALTDDFGLDHDQPGTSVVLCWTLS